MEGYRARVGRPQAPFERVTLSRASLGPHDVRIRVRAVSLNYRDLMIAHGNYPISSDRPPIAVADGAGEVIEVGPQVTRFRVGARVASIYFSRWLDGDPTPAKLADVPGATVDGLLAEEVVMSEDAVVAVPDHLDFNEAATLPCAGVTAWNALFVAGRVPPGGSVLVLGTGGVSIWALQLAKAAGLRAIVTSSSDEKLARAKALGADATINYRKVPEWQQEVLRLTGGEGVDLVVEVGGNGTLDRSVAAVRMNGTVALIGGVAGFTAGLQIMPLLVGAKRLVGITVGSREMFEHFNRFVSAARIRPVVDRVFAFDDAPKAIAQLEQGAHFGKLVIGVGS